ncbi:hypothetical protein [Neobacillus terrae]|uniref:hypothetical protein n=1 Tax=Neobacillus terrae TaxID=3034837 RepID=UPI00140D8A87|nr:hypothetical protein [Neobacillus terrae]NHM33737.1 hypothetical protein [Neobacillus terrae]
MNMKKIIAPDLLKTYVLPPALIGICMECKISNAGLFAGFQICTEYQVYSTKGL